MPTQAAWRNRVIGNADVDPAQLLANPRNFRRHPTEQQNALSGVITEIGYLDPVMVQAGTDMVIDGHLRVELAMRQHQPTIPVQYVDLTDDEAALALATFDPLTAMAYHDQEQLDALLAEISTDDAGVQALLDSLTAPDFDPNEHWQGMPEFQQEDQTAIYQCRVNFARPEDVDEFEKLIGQHIPRDRNSVWYPAAKIESYRDKAYVDAV